MLRIVQNLFGLFFQRIDSSKKRRTYPTSFAQSVEKLTGAHTEGEIKVLVELFQKLAGS